MQPKLKRFYAHINTHFIQQAHITLIIILKKMDSTEILSSTTVFNIYNHKNCFLSKSAY